MTASTTPAKKKKPRQKKKTKALKKQNVAKPKNPKDGSKTLQQKKNDLLKNIPFSSPLTADFVKDDDDKEVEKRMEEKRKKKREFEAKKQVEEEEELREEQRLTAQIFGVGVGMEEEEENVEDLIDYEEDEEEEDMEDGGVGGGESRPLFEINRTGVATMRVEEDGIMDEVDYEEESDTPAAADDDDDGNEENKEEKKDDGKVVDNQTNNDKSDSSDDEMETSKPTLDPSKPAWQDTEDHNDNDSSKNNVSLMTNARTRKLRTSKSETQPISKSDYEERLRTRFSETVSRSTNIDWAALPSSKENKAVGKKGKEDLDSDFEEEEAEDPALELLDSNAPLLSTSSDSLPPTTIELKRLPDVNLCDSRQLNATVQAVQFFPKEEEKPMVLTAGMDKMLRFYKVGCGEKGVSKKVQGVYFDKLPIYSASFLGTSGNVVLSGRRPFFYIYDVVAGKIDHVPRILGRAEKSLEKFTTSPDGKLIAFIGNDGYIILVDARTKHWVADLKLNGSVRALSFTPDSQFILGSGSDGDVYRFDIRSKRCVDKFQNEDGTITSAISVTDRFLAVGAESGVVNLYNDSQSNDQALTSSSTTDEWGSPMDFFSPYDQPQRRPIKSLMNLQTSADVVKFNTDGQILAMSTRREKNGLRLLHVPTATVFSNWPTTKTPLGYVWSMDFSPNSKYFAMGNDKGKCLLYKLQHYSDGKY